MGEAPRPNIDATAPGICWWAFVLEVLTIAGILIVLNSLS
jgi:hypothetical protein